MSAHICSKIICGGCRCEYCPQCHNGCPQCGKGEIRTTSTNTTTANERVVNESYERLRAKPKNSYISYI